MCVRLVCVCVYAGRKKRGVSLKRFKNEFEIFDFVLHRWVVCYFPVVVLVLHLRSISKLHFTYLIQM